MDYTFFTQFFAAILVTFSNNFGYIQNYFTSMTNINSVNKNGRDFNCAPNLVTDYGGHSIKISEILNNGRARPKPQQRFNT